MILAAGLGTRLRPATLKIPKPAIPLLNVPLVGYSIYLLKKAGVSELVCNTHHLPEIMKDVVRRMTSDSTFQRVDFSDEEGMILGSAGGLKHAEKFLRGAGEIFLANGDEVFFPKNPLIMKRLQEMRQKTSALATLLVQEHPLVGSKFGGVWVDPDGRVRGFGKTPPASTDNNSSRAPLKGLHFTGYQILDEKILDLIPEGKESNIFYDVLVKAIADGALVNIVVDQGRWLEMGNATDFLEASHDLMATLEGVLKNRNSSSSFKDFFDWGWENFDPSTFEQRGSARIVVSNSVSLSSNLVFSGDVTIARGFRPPPRADSHPQRISNTIFVGKIHEPLKNPQSDELCVGDYTRV